MRRAALSLGLGLSVLLAPLGAHAAILIEGVFAGQPVRVISQFEGPRVLIEHDGARHLLDFATGHAYEVSRQPAARSAIAVPGGLGAYRMQRWAGGGSRVAGHTGVLHVLRRGDRLCAEALVSPWMGRLTGGAVQALGWLQRRVAAPSVSPCGAIPFAAFAGAGYPLIAGGPQKTLFTTDRIEFAVEMADSTFDLPRDWREADG